MFPPSTAIVSASREGGEKETLVFCVSNGKKGKLRERGLSDVCAGVRYQKGKEEPFHPFGMNGAG